MNKMNREQALERDIEVATGLIASVVMEIRNDLEIPFYGEMQNKHLLDLHNRLQDALSTLDYWPSDDHLFTYQD